MSLTDVILARPLLFGAGFAAFAALLVHFMAKARRNPINDICTDPDSPVDFVQPPPTARGGAYHAKMAPIQRRLYPSLRPLTVADASWTSFLASCKALAESRGWEIVSTDEASSRVQFLCITPLMRFRDDFVLQLRKASSGAYEVHARSKSRLGRSDLGANHARIVDALRFIDTFLKSKGAKL